MAGKPPFFNQPPGTGLLHASQINNMRVLAKQTHVKTNQPRQPVPNRRQTTTAIPTGGAPAPSAGLTLSTANPTAVGDTATPGSTGLATDAGHAHVLGGTVGGNLSGTLPNPLVAKIHETSGPTDLTIGTITDGQFLKRSGSTLVSAAVTGVVAALAGKLAIGLMDGQSPAFVGGQMAEIIMPYDASGGSLTWSLDNFVWSMGTAGTTQSQILFEKSTGSGVFSASPTQSSTYTLAANTAKLTQTGISAFTFSSGDKLRLNVVAIGTASQNWTIWAQFTSGGTGQKMIVQCVVGGWTPSATGADSNEFVLPFGTFGDSRFYSLQQVFLRNRRAGAGTSTFYFQSTQTVASGFTDVPGISALFTMSANGFELATTSPGAFYAASGDKYRLNIQSLSVLSMYWTLIVVWTYN